MTETNYITVDEAAERLGKSASQVRRDARDRKLNSIKDKGRVWIRDDDRMRAAQDGRVVFSPRREEEVPSAGILRSTTATSDLIEEICELRVDLTRLTARVRKLEAAVESQSAR